MSILTPIAVLVVIVLAAYFVFRPLFPLFSSRPPGTKSKLKMKRTASLRDAALEAAALASLMLNFPYTMLGVSSFAVLLAFALGLALLPKVVAPVLGFAIVLVSITRLDMDKAMRLIVVLIAFLALRFLFGWSRRFIGQQE